MNIGTIKPREISKEMQESYLDYAMSVIVARALPDVRDGLKPVHRRILYAMHEMGLGSGAKFRKSANIVGAVLGAYHPHGDSAVYDSMVRMAQEFSLRYPLIDGQGNFGSIDGDPAAAYRYTEARMTKIAGEMLHDIDKDTVEWRDNYDATRKEPKVLPAAIPNLLLNGSVGIAVGMATNIPPHNLSEVIDALVHLIAHPKATLEDLFQFIQGPDFPTGGTIYGRKGIMEAYGQGKGPIILRGEAEIYEDGGKRGIKGPYIEITELPYVVNKASFIEDIARLVQDGRLEGIRDVRDESDKQGMSVVIELKRDAHAQKILNNLYKFTELQRTFHLNMLALVDGIQPQVLSLKEVLEQYLKHKHEVVRRRTEFDLARARDRAHILEGLKKALDHIDAVIKTIRASRDREDAHANLKKKFKFSDAQAAAILEMRLQNLANLERKRVEDELKEKLRLIKELTLLLKDAKLMWAKIKEELLEVKARYGGERKTRVRVHALGELSDIDLIPEEETIISITKGGYIKRVAPAVYRMQHRGGKGLIGMERKGDDVAEHFFAASTHDRILFFTSAGRAFHVPRVRVGARDLPIFWIYRARRR
jgi:DNA gyrase subunit A